MGEKIIDEKNILLKTDANDWETSIRKAGELLCKSNYAEDNYVQAMVDAVKELGPYIVLAPGIAFAHARPESGVLKTGISLITLDNPVEFGNKDNDPVSTVFAIASKDNTSHIGILRDLCEFLEENENLNLLKECTCPTEIANKINNYRKEA